MFNVIYQVHYLKTDFEKWRDEDDSDVDENEDFNLDEVSLMLPFLVLCILHYCNFREKMHEQR